MIVDASALVAVLRQEPGWQAVRDKLRDDRTISMSAATFLETAIVVDSARDVQQSRLLDQLLAALSVQIVDVTLEQARVARQAYSDYGKGSGSRARLNFGDCFSYALAIVTGEPLLFIGDDFTHTDVIVA